MTYFEDLIHKRYKMMNAHCKTDDYEKVGASLHRQHHLYRNLRHVDNWSILACLPPKTGSSNMVRLLNALLTNTKIEDQDPFFPNGTWNQQFYTTLPRMAKTHSKWINHTSIHYPMKLEIWKEKLIVVRHPFARLYSCWKDKFNRHPEIPGYENSPDTLFFSKWDTEIMVYFDPDHDVIEENARVSFQSFLKWLAYSPSAFTDRYNEHWGIYYQMCRPCDIEYKYILKTESLSEEIQFVMKDLKIPEKVGHFKGSYETSETKKRPNEQLDQFYNKLVELYLDVPRQVKHDLYKVYKNDFSLFNYAIKPFLI